jgi:hypothetical protein
MGTTRASEQALAAKVTAAVKQPKQTGRYDIAYKAEVEARLKQVCAAIDEEIEEVRTASGQRDDWAKRVLHQHERALQKLNERVEELELSRWQRIKRWVSEFFEDVMFALSSVDDPTLVVQDSPYLERVNEAAAAFQAEHGQSVGDAARADIEDLEQRPAYLDGNCPDCGQVVGIIIQGGPGAHHALFDMGKTVEDVQIHICPTPAAQPERIAAAIAAIEADPFGKPLVDSLGDPYGVSELELAERERLRFTDPFIKDEPLGDPNE